MLTAGSRIRPALRWGSIGVLVTAILILAIASAGAIPALGHPFFGTVKNSQGMSVPNGVVVAAKAITGNWQGQEITLVGASAAAGSYFLTVPADDLSTPLIIEGPKDGDHIVFLVAGAPAKMYDVAQAKYVDWVAFVSGGPGGTGTQLNLESDVKYTITATAGTGGSISPSGDVLVEIGTSQTFTITPAANYAILDVVVDGVSQGAIGTYTFNNVMANHTISASFKSTLLKLYLPIIFNQK